MLFIFRPDDRDGRCSSPGGIIGFFLAGKIIADERRWCWTFVKIQIWRKHNSWKNWRRQKKSSWRTGLYLVFMFCSKCERVKRESLSVVPPSHGAMNWRDCVHACLRQSPSFSVSEWEVWILTSINTCLLLPLNNWNPATADKQALWHSNWNFGKQEFSFTESGFRPRCFVTQHSTG